MIALLALPLTLLSLQQPAGANIAQRLAGRVSPELASLVVEFGTAASTRGLPIDPLIEKAIEGSAKGVPAERVATAEFAITAGLSGSDITALARTGANAQALTVGLRVAGTLAAIGVPPAEDIGLVSVTLRSGEPSADLLLLPAHVQSEVARGVTPAQAAAGLARAAAAQARHGPPPIHPTHPPHPPPPPHP